MEHVINLFNSPIIGKRSSSSFIPLSIRLGITSTFIYFLIHNWGFIILTKKLKHCRIIKRLCLISLIYVIYYI